MEIDTTPSSPTLTTSARVTTCEEWREAEGRPQLTTPLNPTSDITSNSQTHFIIPMHPDTQAVDEAFVMANYLQSEPLITKKELRFQGVVICLNYSSEDVNEERELKVPLGFRSQPPKGTKGVNVVRRVDIVGKVNGLDSRHCTEDKCCSKDRRCSKGRRCSEGKHCLEGKCYTLQVSLLPNDHQCYLPLYRDVGRSDELHAPGFCEHSGLPSVTGFSFAFLFLISDR
nr:hypothetical protein [Tanacetum cinerariifolium]